MEVVLSIIRCPEGVALGDRRSTGADVLMGRDPGCDWVLPDPERHVSGRHCTIEFRGGEWRVRDQSTNGTFLNRAAEPIGRDRSESLADGDRLRLGDYEIEVRIAGGAGAGARFGSNAAASALDSPFGQPPSTTGWPVAIGDPLAPSSVLPDQENPFRVPGPAGLGVARPASAPQPWAGVADSPFSLDPVPGPAASAGQPYGLPGAEDVLRAAPPVPDHVPSGHDAFIPPRVIPAPQSLPDDWDFDPAEPLPATKPRQLAPAPPPRGSEATPPAAGAEAALAAFLAGAGLRRGEAPPAADPLAALSAMGAAFGAAVAALRTLLAARGEVKREFRIEQTMLRAAGNNPLKFAPSDAAAVAQLLGLGGAAAAGVVRLAASDLEAHQLATLAATQAAARALLDRLCPEEVEAEAERSGATGGLAVLPAQRRARLWEEYTRLHHRLVVEFEEDFESAFGEAFARAYEDAEAAAKRRGG